MGDSRLGNRYNFTIVFFVALGSFTYGFNSSIVGTILGLPTFYPYFNLALEGPGLTHTNNMIGAMNGLYAGGGIIGCCIIAYVANLIGRKRSVQVICALCIISAIIQAAAVHIAMILVGRFFNGIGVGMMNVVVPLYQSEISPPGNRGRMVGSHGFLIVVGYAVAGWTGLGCYFDDNPQVGWRLCFALQLLAPILLAAGSSWLPESPRWLAQRQRDSEALHVLKELHDSPNDLEHASATIEFQQIQRQIEIDSSMPNGILATIKKPSYRKRFFYGIFVQCIAQSTGVLVINNYQVILYNGLGISGYLPLMLYAIYASWAAFLNWAGALIVDRVGRIRMLLIGIVGCASAVILETIMLARFGGTTNRVGNGFGVFFLFVFVTFYGSCVDAISYVYCSEIFPTTLRAQGLGFSVVGLFGMNLIYTQLAPTAFASVGWKYYLVFIVVPLLGAPFIAYAMPETKGLSLEEIGALFGDETVSTSYEVDEKSKTNLNDHVDLKNSNSRTEIEATTSVHVKTLG